MDKLKRPQHSQNSLAHFSLLTGAREQPPQHLSGANPRQECVTPAGRDAGADPSAGEPRAGWDRGDPGGGRRPRIALLLTDLDSDPRVSPDGMLMFAGAATFSCF